MSRRPIIDEFTHLKVSKQRKWQLRRQAERRCRICGQPAVGNAHCLKHMVALREGQRVKRGSSEKRRYYGARSYRLEDQAQ